MYFDPYKTSTIAATSTTRILEDIHKAEILGLMYSVDLRKLNPNNCVFIHAACDNVKPFAHPLVDPKTKLIYLDVRGYTSISKAENSLEVRNSTELGFQKLRVNLINQTIEHGKESLYSACAMSLEVFANWLANLISSRFNLEPDVQARILAICGLYYYCLFKGDGVLLDADERMATCMAVGRRISFRDTSKIMDIADELVKLEFPKPKFREVTDTFSCIEHLCFAIKELSQSVKLHEFSPGLLVTLTGSSWFGPSGELVSVALEDPTTWIALVAYSIKSDTYKKTKIGDVTHRFRREHDVFVKSISRLESLIN